MHDDEFLKEVGFKLKMCRLRAGMTQAQLGEVVDMSEHRISEIENGHCNITLKSVNRLFSALGINFLKWMD